MRTISYFFCSSRRRHTRFDCDWSSDVCSSDLAAIFAQLTAFDALKAAGIPLRANLRFVWEGEEEAGSPHLEQILNANHDLVHGDVWLVCDGPVDQSGEQTVVFG